MTQSIGYPLYNASMEHGSCGVGFIADTRGTARSDILPMALNSLRNLAHRGAVGADALTGDGAGITIGLSQRYFKDEFRRLYHDNGLTVPPAVNGVAVGMFFLPRTDIALQTTIRQLIHDISIKHDFHDFVWRRVPTCPDVLGVKAAASMPHIEQLLIGINLQGNDDELTIDRRLYAARRDMEKHISALLTPDNRDSFYVVSMSCRTIIYKGLMMVNNLDQFYDDLRHENMETAFAILHQRYSTNTFPSWTLAQPFRMISHNGEINTILGNRNGTALRESDISSPLWSSESLESIRPILSINQSDSASMDSVTELLALSGRSLWHSVVMLMPPAWTSIPDCDAEVRAFYEYHACLNEPWDGPAALVFSDGHIVGASLDRNGLRPARFQRTNDHLLIVSSEVGICDLTNRSIIESGRLGPGEVIGIDLLRGELLRDQAIKSRLSRQAPYKEWVDRNLVHIAAHQCVNMPRTCSERESSLTIRQACFGYSKEEITYLFEPMTKANQEPISSMGDDTPLAILSKLPRLLPTYFKQRFAQVTNPPIDPIREKLVMSLGIKLGRRRNWLAETEAHAKQVNLSGPCIIGEELNAIIEEFGGEKVCWLDATFEADCESNALEQVLDTLCQDAESAIDKGCEILILSDRKVSTQRVPIPILLASGAVNQHLLRQKKRLRASLIVDSGEPRDVHHFATLIGYGISAVHPYLALETIAEQVCEDRELLAQYIENFRHVIHQGLLKIMSKMGISVMGSYRGSQTFEIIGLSDEVVQRCFPNTPSPIGGLSFADIAQEAIERHRFAYADESLSHLDDLGYFRFRRHGEVHAWGPKMLGAMGGFRRQKDDPYPKFAEAVKNTPPVHLRDLLIFRSPKTPIELEEVEPIEAIRRRFTTAAMSLGSLSPEAHEAIAIAMNRIGGKSNTGEGGEDRRRYRPQPSGDSANCAIKQVASGRFGVTPEYLMQAKEIEIKMAQGSKPGEGGQLPGHKVTHYIAELRYATPGVSLISPPPHHDIYSIEDLAQLIYDLKQINPVAQICVKLVSEAGVGTIAAGVAKAHADVILISGHDGGTGASPLSSIKNAGSAWELGLAETQQTLILNGLRERVKLRVDGGLKTGRDVVIAALLGAEEYNFGTAALIAIGCRYVRQCHLDTCPVGIATQRPDLRTKFDGNPDALVAYFNGVAKDIRQYLAQLGARNLQEIVGRVELLEQITLDDHHKANRVDLSKLLCAPPKFSGARVQTWERNSRPRHSLNDRIMADCHESVDRQVSITRHYTIRNVDRTVGARLSGYIAQQNGNEGLVDSTIKLFFDGSAGQSFGAFNINGVELCLKGECNDYVGKGMNGGHICVSPPDSVTAAHDYVLIGNTVLYGATGGHFWCCGRAGERFAVRNSGASAVIEGVGDHCCEYMTNGIIIVLGTTGKNFGAGMTGGLAYVYDPQGDFPISCHRDFVLCERINNVENAPQLKDYTEQHYRRTGSQRSKELLDNWSQEITNFWQVLPIASLRAKTDNSDATWVLNMAHEDLEVGGE